MKRMGAQKNTTQALNCSAHIRPFLVLLCSIMSKIKSRGFNTQISATSVNISCVANTDPNEIVQVGRLNCVQV